MKSRKLTCITALIVFVALAMPLQLTAQQTRYTVTDLGTLGGNNSIPFGINNRGQVVGFAETPDTDPNCECLIIHAFLWNNGIHDLGTLGGRNSGAGLAGVNPEGQVVGFVRRCKEEQEGRHTSQNTGANHGYMRETEVLRASYTRRPVCLVCGVPAPTASTPMLREWSATSLHPSPEVQPMRPIISGWRKSQPASTAAPPLP